MRGLKHCGSWARLAVSDFYPEQIVGEEFVRATVSWLQMTGWELPVYVPRIRYAPLEINQTGFDRGQPKPPPPFRAVVHLDRDGLKAEGQYQMLGKVGNGFSDAERKKWLKAVQGHGGGVQLPRSQWF